MILCHNKDALATEIIAAAFATSLCEEIPLHMADLALEADPGLDCITNAHVENTKFSQWFPY